MLEKRSSSTTLDQRLPVAVHVNDEASGSCRTDGRFQLLGVDSQHVPSRYPFAKTDATPPAGKIPCLIFEERPVRSRGDELAIGDER